MRLPALALLLLALPGVVASPAGSDPVGDQTTSVGTSSSFDSAVGAPTPCSAPATDVVGVAAASTGGVVTLGLAVADLSDETLSCGAGPLATERVYAIRFDLSPTLFGYVYKDVQAASTLVCDTSTGDVVCVLPPTTFATDGNALTWSFPISGEGWDLAGEATLRAGARAYVLHDPWYTGFPTVSVSDRTASFTATF